MPSPSSPENLFAFGRTILGICAGLGIDPIVYGSLAYFCGARDAEMPVHDIDLLVPEAKFPELMAALTAANVAHEKKSWPSIVCTDGEAKVELDSRERYLAARPADTFEVEIAGLRLDVLNPGSLEDIYREAVERILRTPEHEAQLRGYERKLANLQPFRRDQ